ncbi:hypothetical protein BU26DRAFT_511433 [Trematosphaeria pertusa]|uniref:C2H2-type domain-containing protein n=1 Tax=Trematosphaeria pertusa TaxID=390896 RepID=A0A6A6HTH8_9PLEO|nr:uncharacterized protein BU26DRAFT_511433 [Trematosphaeria pertusa]KAF2241321.1 hypothetical protein BU26DRAFT_511433 [Trematosphaeria pertusa]
MQNLMMGHANIRTFLKHYLSRRVTVDTQAVVRGIQPQGALMRAACTMSRSIDYRRPQRLTPEQSALVNNYPTDVEQQLAGIKIKDDVKGGHGALLPAQKELVNAILARPGLTLEEEISWRNTAISAVMRYCGIEEGGIHPSRPKRLSGRITPPGKNEDNAQLDLDEKALEAAKVAVYKETRPRICFVCLGNENLPTELRTYSFYTLGDLSKHFKRKHLQYIKEGDQLGCSLCQVWLEDKMHLQRHACEVHGTVSLKDKLEAALPANSENAD